MLADVLPADFDAYLARIRGPYRRFLDSRPALVVPDDDDVHDDDAERSSSSVAGSASDLAASGTASPRASASAPASRVGGANDLPSADDAPSSALRALRSRKDRGAPHPIPPVFFLDRFSLADPETFRLACPVDDVDRACGSMSAVALERLSHLSDVVESALVDAVGENAEAVFGALPRALTDARDATEETASAIASARRNLGDASARIDRDAALIRGLARKRRNLADLAERLAALAEIRDATADAATLLEEGEIEGALDAADQIRDLLGRPPELTTEWNEEDASEDEEEDGNARETSPINGEEDLSGRRRALFRRRRALVSGCAFAASARATASRVRASCASRLRASFVAAARAPFRRAPSPRRSRRRRSARRSRSSRSSA